ncbi:SDR family NAD(P)-dependent oxidoreductase [Nocardia transvalensis]|uniref:SDR family NAD(P)-dependent oxidoreductase n=1 Tax=Nocardia transvalensis TaxID=37333 RepID=UPI00189399C9|nr:SDR family oxidoreductase [Nocardia transvalensis]MBF6327716.1 SDR family oxidoreductase [Nocardia transvalensis]
MTAEPDANSVAADYRALFRLDGKRALVIGAGSGIGRESALALAALGAEVVCADIDAAKAEETAQRAGAPAVALQVDARDAEAVDAAAHALPELDVLVFTTGRNVRKRVFDYAIEEFDAVLDLNLRAAFHIIRAFGKGMVARGAGSIVGLSSIRAVTVEPGQAVYAASKAALVQLIRGAAAEFGPSGVRVNAVAPGVVRTPLTDSIFTVPEWRAAYASKSALGRWAEPSEIAGAVAFLAADASSFVTGTMLSVDGGWTAVDGRYDPPC